MKKLLYVLLTLLLLSGTVSADVLWEPYENDYYNKHMDEMEVIAAKYEVPEGMTANIYTSPINGKLIETMDAGTVVYVGFSIEESGEVWATGYPLGSFDNEGWFRLGRLQKQYSHTEFVNDFADQIAAEEAWLTAADVGGSVHTWTYPGSGVSDGVIPEEALTSDYNEGHISYGLVYTDPDGGKWGYIGYHMGHVGWMYLDDPTDPEPSLRLYPEAENTVTDTSPNEEAANPAPYVLVFALVGILAAATALAIVNLKKKHPVNQ